MNHLTQITTTINTENDEKSTTEIMNSKKSYSKSNSVNKRPLSCKASKSVEKTHPKDNKSQDKIQSQQMLYEIEKEKMLNNIFREEKKTNNNNTGMQRKSFNAPINKNYYSKLTQYISATNTNNYITQYRSSNQKYSSGNNKSFNTQPSPQMNYKNKKQSIGNSSFLNGNNTKNNQKY